jgi:predicted nuclease of predicted toxin-antitoxin system
LTGFLADENVPAPSVTLLRRTGYDVISVLEERPGASDVEIIRWSAESGRVIITFDRDFGDLIFQRVVAPPAGVIFIRGAAASPTEPGELVARILEEIGPGVLGQLITVDRRHARLRSLRAMPDQEESE